MDTHANEVEHSNTDPSSQSRTSPEDDPTLRSAESLAAELGVDAEHGLTSEEAARRLAADGPNELTGTPPEPGWRKLLRQFQDPLI